MLIILGLSVFYFKQYKANNQSQGNLKEIVLYEEDGIRFLAKTEGKDFLVYEDEKWQKKFLKGVNIGAAKPGYFPGELAITKDEYLRWFQYISDMNAEVIRVYTTLKPEFYDALYEFNQNSSKPLYLIQGVWVKEEDKARLLDAYGENELIKNDFIKDACDLVDVFHGNARLPEKRGFASGIYNTDVSPYVIAWVLGIEWDPLFVEGTNLKNEKRNNYSGNYLYTEGASPFETFLCEVADQVLEYEIEKYQLTRPLSFSNWPTTDMLEHPNEPYEHENMAEVNTEHIKAQESYKSGLFASYHIYPYYPDFISYQKEYREFIDEQGNINTYKAYLRDLIKEHSVPVLVAEFGVPASRGKAHDAIHSGYNQGFHDEAEQGEIIVSLMQDIYDEDYCGALIFSWQDEWFKKTWNTMDFDLPYQRPFWSNPQTNEQQFGLLAFDPGRLKSVAYIDGDISEWQEEEPTILSDSLSLYMKADEKYLYLMLETKDFDFENDFIYIPIDTVQEQGNTWYDAEKIQFSRPADFLIRINGEDNSRIFVDAYYDSFYFIYGEKQNMVAKNQKYREKDSGIFNPLYLCLSREVFLPEDQKIIPFSKYETGILKHGNANPEHEDFNSLSDFAYHQGKLEIRVPWQLLNVMDPSTKAVMGDFYKNNGFEAENIEGIYLGAEVLKKGEKLGSPIDMAYYSWKAWEMPSYHERLKPSYYSVQAAFKRIE